MIEGLSHITFIVKDLERMKLLLVGALGGREVYDSGDKQFSLSREKFFEVGGVWIAVMEGDPLSEKTYNHVAFKASHAIARRSKNSDCQSANRVRASTEKANLCISTISTITFSNCTPACSPIGLPLMHTSPNEQIIGHD
jgi:hypothetical protein